MSRVVFFLALILFSAAVRAGEPVVVRKGAGEFARTIEITLPEPSSEVQFHYAFLEEPQTSGEIGPLDPNSSTNPKGVGKLSRKGRAVYLLELFPSTVKISIRVDRLVYHVDPNCELGVPKSEPAPPPIPWDQFIVPSLTNISPEIRQRALRASVRVVSPMGIGSGTIVEVPSELDLKASLHPGEELVVAAGHVTPEFLASVACEVHVFAYQGEKAVRYEKCPARLLYARRESEVDLAVLATKIPSHVKFARIPIATDKHWFIDGAEYLRVGCPEGKDPVLQIMRPIQAQFRWDGGYVTMDQASVGGQSGGGLVSTDGFLVGVLSGTDGPEIVSGEKPLSTFARGAFLVSRDAPDRRPKLRGDITTRSSSFTRPSGLRVELAAVEKETRNRLGWITLKLPSRSEFGVPPDAAQGFATLRADLDRAVNNLPASQQAKVKREFENALRSYEEALTK
ncbi:MAG: hypothetical protein U0136_16275 [Bdellovibrionota bacterium]